MTRRAAVSGFLFAIFASLTPCWVHASGVNIRWNGCVLDGGVSNRTFACTSNVGVQRLFLSFVPDHDMADVVSFEMYATVVTASTNLPAWWSLKSVGSCRQNGLNMTLGGAALSCADWAQDQAAGGIANYRLGTVGPNSARIEMVVAVLADFPQYLSAGEEYQLGVLTLNNQKTVGTGSCSGCTTPAAIFFDGIQAGFLGGGTEVISLPAAEPESQWATWQNGILSDLVRTPCTNPPDLICRLGLATSYVCSNGLAMRWLRSGRR